VIDGAAETSHRVTLRAEEYDRITSDKADPADLVRRAISLLLSREHPKPIPPECDLTIFASFFAEFERAKRNALTT
jgi:hypothetical protein